MSEWNFVESRIFAYGYTAKMLMKLTGVSWRPGDVEIAVFSARDLHSPNPLNTLPSDDTTLLSRPTGKATGASRVSTAGWDEKFETFQD